MKYNRLRSDNLSFIVNANMSTLYLGAQGSAAFVPEQSA